MEEIKYCSDLMKENFDKELVIAKENNEDFEKWLNVGPVKIIMLIMILK